MKLFQQHSIKKKLSSITLLTSGIAIAFGCMIFIATEVFFNWQEMVRHHTVLAKSIGLNIRSAILFGDTTYVSTALKVLVINPDVEAAYVYNKSNELLADYFTDKQQVESFPITHLLSNQQMNPEQYTTEFHRHRLLITRFIQLEDEVIGYIVLQMSLKSFYTHIAWVILMAMIVFILINALSYIIWQRLQILITEPIERLMKISTEVSKNEDYSLRVQVEGEDELAKLGLCFNEMLAQIQLRDIELTEHREHLESEVKNRTRQAEKASKAKSEFLATMSHEIRTPMNAVIGMTELLLNTKMEAKQERYAKMILNSSSLLLNIINDILDFSKIEANKLELEEIIFQPNQVLLDVRDTFSNQAACKNLQLEINEVPGLTGYVIGDPFRLKQILNNLVSNAIKFTNQGHVTINLDLVAEDERGMDFCFSVQDTGMGIKNETLKELFTVFHQADNSTTREFGGTGLGLAISQDLTRLMGGRIQVESTVGSGSRFYFTLHFKKVTPQELSINAKLQELSQEVLSNEELNYNDYTILLTDDDPVNQEVISNILENFGFNFEVAVNGLEAIELINSYAKNHFDLVLMDIQMPGLDGYDATRKLRESGFTAPIIALSAHANQEAFDAAFKAGMDDYLSKPIQMDTLNAAMQRWLGLNALLKLHNNETGIGNGKTTPGSQATEQSRTAEHAAAIESSSPAKHATAAEEVKAVEDSLIASVIMDDSFALLTCVSLNEILERLNNNTGLLKKLLEKFYETYGDYFVHIQDAFDSHQYLQVSELAHKIKGASRSLGIEGVGMAAEKLELSLKNGMLREGTNYNELLMQLKEELSESTRQLGEFLQTRE